MNKLEIWEVVSFAWTEIGLEESDYPIHAEKIYAECQDWSLVNRVIIKDVCASFAFDSFLIVPCMLWMIMPDWGYDKDYLQKRMNKWYSKPYWVHFLNPARVLGFPTALILSMSVRRKLKRAFLECAANTKA